MNINQVTKSQTAQTTNLIASENVSLIKPSNVTALVVGVGFIAGVLYIHKFVCEQIDLLHRSNSEKRSLKIGSFAVLNLTGAHLLTTMGVLTKAQAWIAMGISTVFVLVNYAKNQRRLPTSTEAITLTKTSTKVTEVTTSTVTASKTTSESTTSTATVTVAAKSTTEPKKDKTTIAKATSSGSKADASTVAKTNTQADKIVTGTKAATKPIKAEKIETTETRDIEKEMIDKALKASLGDLPKEEVVDADEALLKLALIESTPPEADAEDEVLKMVLEASAPPAEDVEKEIMERVMEESITGEKAKSDLEKDLIEKLKKESSEDIPYLVGEPAVRPSKLVKLEDLEPVKKPFAIRKLPGSKDIIVDKEKELLAHEGYIHVTSKNFDIDSFKKFLSSKKTPTAGIIWDIAEDHKWDKQFWLNFAEVAKKDNVGCFVLNNNAKEPISFPVAELAPEELEELLQLLVKLKTTEAIKFKAQGLNSDQLSIALENLPEIRILDLSGTEITQIELHQLYEKGFLSQVWKIDLTNCKNLSTDVIELLAKMVKLTRIKLSEDLPLGKKKPENLPKLKNPIFIKQLYGQVKALQKFACKQYVGPSEYAFVFQIPMVMKEAKIAAEDLYTSDKSISGQCLFFWLHKKTFEKMPPNPYVKTVLRNHIPQGMISDEDLVKLTQKFPAEANIRAPVNNAIIEEILLSLDEGNAVKFWNEACANDPKHPHSSYNTTKMRISRFFLEVYGEAALEQHEEIDAVPYEAPPRTYEITIEGKPLNIDKELWSNQSNWWKKHFEQVSEDNTKPDEVEKSEYTITYKTFKFLYEYILNNDITLNMEKAMDLLAPSQYYEMPLLTKKCWDFLKKNVKDSTPVPELISVYLIAFESGNQPVLDECHTLLIKKMDDINPILKPEDKQKELGRIKDSWASFRKDKKINLTPAFSELKKMVPGFKIKPMAAVEIVA